MTRKQLALIAVFSLISLPAMGETFVFQDGVSPTPDYAGTQDTHII